MEPTKTQLSRREAMKALAAAGGALATAAFLPGKWSKPLVESGVLPAHAQSSCLYVAQVTTHGVCVSECPEGAELFVTFDWLPGDIPDGIVFLYGGVAPQVAASSILGGHGEYYFNPGIGSSGWNGQLTLVWGNCTRVLNWNDAPPS